MFCCLVGGYGMTAILEETAAMSIHYSFFPLFLLLSCLFVVGYHETPIILTKKTYFRWLVC